MPSAGGGPVGLSNDIAVRSVTARSRNRAGVTGQDTGECAYTDTLWLSPDPCTIAPGGMAVGQESGLPALQRGALAITIIVTEAALDSRITPAQVKPTEINEAWRQDYNESRPHSTLNDLAPAG